MTGFTLSIQLDQEQYQTLLAKLDAIQQLVLQSIEDPKRFAELTGKLRASEDVLRSVLDQNKT